MLPFDLETQRLLVTVSPFVWLFHAALSISDYNALNRCMTDKRWIVKDSEGSYAEELSALQFNLQAGGISLISYPWLLIQSLPDRCTIPEFSCGETAKNHEKCSVWVTRTTAYLYRYFMVELTSVPPDKYRVSRLNFAMTTSFQIIYTSSSIVTFDSILSEILTKSHNTLHKKKMCVVNVIHSQILFDFITDCIENVLYYGKQLLLTNHDSTTECILLSCLTLQCA